MTSQIDTTQPRYGTPTTKSVRDNFAVAAQEISELQDATADFPYLPLTGGTMTGSLMLAFEPGSAREAATKAYVDMHSRELVIGGKRVEVEIGPPDSAGQGYRMLRVKN